MRGKERHEQTSNHDCRITPAYAGKSVLIALMMFSAMGSPPRMRGKVFLAEYRPAGAGITPAYAGKRSSLCWILHPIQDHPRVCGEKPRTFSRRSPKPGSPPRMRGKELAFENCLFAQRITPAYAGKRIFSRILQGRYKDHPRICGEKA